MPPVWRPFIRFFKTRTSLRVELPYHLMPLKSPRFASVSRLQQAAINSPVVCYGESGEPVRVLQQALIDLGFPLLKSTHKYNSPDGVFGDETVAGFKAFQTNNKLGIDGVVGAKTMAKLDELLPTSGAPLPPLPP